MKTKIILLIIAFKALSITAAFAQEKNQPLFYGRIYGGYSVFTQGSDLVGEHGNDFGYANIDYSQSKQGAGAGINYGFGIMAPISKMWLAGIDVNYLAGKEVKFDEIIHNVSFGNATYYTQRNHSVWSITPNIAYKLLTTANYFIYTKFGLMMTVNTKSSLNYGGTLNFTDGSSSVYTGTGQYKYGLNLGAQAAAGIQYKITSRFSLFGELTGNFLTLRPKSSIEQEIVTNKDNQGTTVIIFNYNTMFKNSSYSTTGPIADVTVVNGATTTHSYNYNFPSPKEHVNNVVLNVGVAFAF